MRGWWVGFPMPSAFSGLLRPLFYCELIYSFYIDLSSLTCHWPPHVEYVALENVKGGLVLLNYGDPIVIRSKQLLVPFYAMCSSFPSHHSRPSLFCRPLSHTVPALHRTSHTHVTILWDVFLRLKRSRILLERTWFIQHTSPKLRESLFAWFLVFVVSHPASS